MSAAAKAGVQLPLRGKDSDSSDC